MPSSHLFCFGLGYSGLTLARRLLALGWQVSGTCRTTQKAKSLAIEGIKTFVFDGEEKMRAAPSAFDGVTHLLNSAPPSDALDPVLRHHQEDLENLSANLQWSGYLSTVGVYGDCGGDWVDETSPVNPISQGSLRRVDAEKQWLAFGKKNGVVPHIFRLPGIYGPHGRNQIARLKAGRCHRIVKQGQVFNRIHVEDIATALLASIERPNAGRIYNVSDDEPAPADEVISYAASLLGIEPPPKIKFEDADLSAFARHFYAECKRVKNDRLKNELGVTLQYPTYRQGHDAIFKRQD